MCQHKSDPHHHHLHAHDHDHDHHSAHEHHHHHHAHDHDHHGAPHDHHHDASQVEPPALSRKDKLIMRLEYYVRHNNEHAGSYTGLADEAIQLGGEEAARLIQTAAEYTAPQNQLLEKALGLLRSL